jgi:hypothetical protein
VANRIDYAFEQLLWPLALPPNSSARMMQRAKISWLTSGVLKERHEPEIHVQVANDD